MKGVSEVIAIILILMITIAIAGLAYTFMSSTMASTTSAASSAVDSTTSSMITSFTIESVDIAKVYIRNTGQTTLSNLSVYVNDELAIYNITPSQIATGQIGTITIYSFIPDGAAVKIASTNGFSISKIVDECSKAMGCWKFSEGIGTTTLDSSPNGNTGTLINGANYTIGKLDSAIILDGVNDYANTTDISFASKLTIVALIRWNGNITGDQYHGIVSKGSWNYAGAQKNWDFVIYPTSRYCWIDAVGGGFCSLSAISHGEWNTVAVMADNTTTTNNINFYTNGRLDGTYSSTNAFGSYPRSITIGAIRRLTAGNSFFNGTIDEVRIYNRAIY